MRYEVILDAGETPNKCTIAPLDGRADFLITRVRGPGSLGRLKSELLLHPDGECLTKLRGTAHGIAAIDCVWPRLAGLLRRIEAPLPKLARIPDGFVTAYPRKSNIIDPDGGLATIEAIFTAAALLGHWDASLLSKYHFGRRYVELNRERFVECEAKEAADPTRLPTLEARPRNALQRRQDRGKTTSL